MAEMFSDTEFGGHLKTQSGQMRQCACKKVTVNSWRREQVTARDGELE